MNWSADELDDNRVQVAFCATIWATQVVGAFQRRARLAKIERTARVQAGGTYTVVVGGDGGGLRARLSPGLLG